MNYPWTAERVAELRGYVERKYSGGRIADLMGMTRNQIAGKVHRLGLSLRSIKARRRPARIRKLIRKRGWRPMQKDPPVLPANPDFLNISLIDIGSAQCRYPNDGHPILFCGQPTQDSSWCAFHQGIVFTKSGQGKFTVKTWSR